MSKLYYEAPSDKIFNEVKEKCIEVWDTYDNTYGYKVDEKVNIIKNMKNISDNIMYMITMFDIVNQRRLANKLSEKTRKIISDKIESVNGNSSYNEFNKK